MRHCGIVVIGLALSSFGALAACSGDDTETSTSSSPTSTTATSSGETVAVPTTDAVASSTTSTTPSPTTADATAPTSTPTGSAPSAPTTTTTAPATPPDPRPLAVEAGGWRLVVERPLAGESIGPSTVICYAASGDSREAIVALDVALLHPGTDSAVGAQLADATVGRGHVTIAFPGVTPGPYDLEVTLVADGSRREDLSLTVPQVEFTTGAALPVCD